MVIRHILLNSLIFRKILIQMSGVRRDSTGTEIEGMPADNFINMINKALNRHFTALTRLGRFRREKGMSSVLP